ncbi:MAG TPA: ribosome small subunit-dependent GTPase A [Bacteroidota bacterium]|nr:ribosome small subunit-dependent GTPase A [Bacteroidota bacterium]
MISLEQLGYNSFVGQHAELFLAKGWTLARITQEHRGSYSIRTELVELPAEVAGRMMFQAASRIDYPAVGDWVAVEFYNNDQRAVIRAIVPRRTTLVRKAIGKNTEQQIIATNVDLVFIVHALDQNFTLSRVERYLVVARESGAMPILILSKKDCCSAGLVEHVKQETQALAKDTPVILYDIHNAEEIASIAAFIQPGKTCCFIGPSGAGKSTLINKLVGHEILATGEVRDFDAKGRHTTTARQLIVLEHGGLLIDTPGIRELGVWSANTGIDETFDDIQELAVQCRFRDCTHTHEPHCAVQQALQDGTLTAERFDSFLKLQQETKFTESKKSRDISVERKEKEKQRSKIIKQYFKHKGRTKQ